MLIYTEKEAQLVAESRQSAYSTVIFFLFTATSFILTTGNMHILFFENVNAQAFKVHLLFCIGCLLFF